MADSYLNKSGLSYFWTKIKNALSLKTDKTDFDLVDRYYRALVPVGTEITSNKNLDTVEFLSVGKYYCYNNATADTLTNCPTDGKAFMMEVFSPLSTNIDNETTGTWVYRTRVITSYEGKTWYQSCYSNETAGNWIYGGWQYMTNSGDVNNQIYANTNSKYGYVRVTSYNADDGKWVKIASMSHHARSNDNVNYTFRLDFTGSENAQYRQSYTFGVGARMTNTSLGSVRFDYLDSEKFNFNGAPEFEDLVKVTRKWVAGSSRADHYIYFEIWVNLNSGWRIYWLHPTNMNYTGDYSLNQAFFRNSDEWAYSSAVGTSAVIGQETYLTDGYEEVPMVDARKGVSYLDPIFTTRQTTADAPEINGRGGIRTFVATSSMSNRPADGNILHLDWDNTGGWDAQLLVSHVDSTNSPNIYARGMRYGTWGDWVRFIRNGDSATFNNIKLDRVNTYPHIGGDGTYLAFSVDGLWGQGHGSIAIKSDSLYPSTTESGLINLGESGRLWKNLYLSDNIHKGDYVLTLPDKTGTVALTSDMPIKVSDLTSDVGGNSYTGTCSTAAATAAKEITISADQNFVLNKGAVIGVKFTATNTAQNPTLNVNNTGAKSIWFNTAVITTGSLNRGGYANRYTYYIYDGTYWVWLNWGTDDNTTYSSMSVAEGQAGTATSQRVVRADYLKQIIQSYVPTTYAGSLITDGSITFDKTASGEFLKLETSTTDPGEGSVLDDNILLAVYDVPDDYRRGEVLVSTQNVDTLATTSNVVTIWSAGTWTQFGRMASSSNKHILTIENPTSNNWTVEISLDCPSVLPGSVISGSSVITTTPATGIAELDSNNEISKVITWSRIASRGSVYNRKYVTIPANTTKKFCACVCTYQTSSNPTGTWEGGDEISGTAVGAGFGGASCTLTATLIDNGE